MDKSTKNGQKQWRADRGWVITKKMSTPKTGSLGELTAVGATRPSQLTGTPLRSITQRTNDGNFEPVSVEPFVVMEQDDREDVTMMGIVTEISSTTNSEREI